jgi:hypothetical protein
MRQSFRALTFVTAAALPAVAPPPALAQQSSRQQQTENAFNWNDHVAAGRWIRVKNLSGSITVGQATGDKVEVTAVKRWRRGDPAVVRFETKRFGPNDESVVICALWGERSYCDEDGYRTRGDDHDRGMRNNDVSVEFRVLVPRGVKVGVNTINGDVTVDGATADIEAGTINGEVDIANAQARVSATNVNGGVRARLTRLEGDGRMDFTTVNGSVMVEMPNDGGADVDLQTVMGTINTNFEMTLQGRFDPKRLRTHIGRPGGPRLKLGPVNGSVELRRR